MNGIIYCRVSSKEQIEGTSLESQQAACREYARTKNIKVLKVFIEQGESAKFADRTALLELIDFCREHKGKVQALLVWKVDRFARNVGDHFNVKATLAKYGVRIVSVTEPIDTNPEGKLMETILAGFAQFDNDIRAMRTVQGMRRKLQEGIFPWKPPLGYKSGTRNGEKKTEPDQPDQPLFSLLQKAWRAFATEAYTKAEIRRLMTRWGITTQRGESLSPQLLDKLFRNPFYAGTLVDPWSDEEYEGRHVPMVSREDFAHVQQIISQRARSIPHQKARPEFPLRGLVRCSSCWHYLTAALSRGRSTRYGYYRCANRRCTRYGKGLTPHPVHEEFERYLAEVAPKQELLEKLEEMIVQRAEERQVCSKVQKNRREAALARVKKEIQELIRMRTRGLITDEEFLAQKTALLEKRNTLEGTPKAEGLAAGQVREKLREITAPLTHLPETWKSLPDPLRPRFQRLVLPVGYENGRIGTAELGLLFATFRALSVGNSNGVALTGESWNRLVCEILDFARVFEDYQTEEKGSEIPVPRNSS